MSFGSQHHRASCDALPFDCNGNHQPSQNGCEGCHNHCNARAVAGLCCECGRCIGSNHCNLVIVIMSVVAAMMIVLLVMIIQSSAMAVAVMC